MAQKPINLITALNFQDNGPVTIKSLRGDNNTVPTSVPDGGALSDPALFHNPAFGVSLATDDAGSGTIDDNGIAATRLSTLPAVVVRMLVTAEDSIGQTVEKQLTVSINGEFVDPAPTGEDAAVVFNDL